MDKIKKYRKVYYEILQALNTEHSIILLIGLRRMGKTYILEQLANEPGGYYVDFREHDYDADNYYELLKDNENNLLLLDEVGYLEGFDDYFGRLLEDLKGTGKKIVMASSAYGTMKQLAKEKLGGGRAHVIELFPLDFEEYLYFSGKMQNYAEEYSPSEQDIWDYFRLEGIAEGMKFIIDERYITDTFSDIKVARDNQYGTIRDVILDERQCASVHDVLAYSLGIRPSVKRLTGMAQIGVRELGDTRGIKIKESLISKANVGVQKLSISDLSKILAQLYHGGFLFAEIITNEESTQSYSGIINDLLSVKIDSELKEILSKYNLSVISPLFYTRLMVNLELVADRLIKSEENNALLGDLFELAMKAETVYQRGFQEYHIAYKYSKNLKEVDIIHKNLIIECSVGYKENNEHHVDEIYPEQSVIRIVTHGVGKYDSKRKESLRYHRIEFPEALLLLSDKSVYDLPILSESDEFPASNNF